MDDDSFYRACGGEEAQRWKGPVVRRSTPAAPLSFELVTVLRGAGSGCGAAYSLLIAFYVVVDLTSQMVKESASKGFLTDEQYFAILLNPSHYSELIHGDGHARSTSSDILHFRVMGNSRVGAILLCKDDVVPDTLAWPNESTRIAKFGGMGVMKVTACYDDMNVERWECQLMSRSMGFKIFHYHEIVDESHKNRISVQSKLSGMNLKVRQLASGSGQKNKGDS